MAKTTAPLLSFGASGAIAKTQVYSSWKGIPYARRYVVPANPNSLAQQDTRSIFKWLSQVYRYMPAAAVAAWQLAANSRQMTDRNLFVKNNLTNLRAGVDLSTFVFAPSANGGLPAAAIALTPGVGQITVALTAPSLPSGWTITEAIAVAVRSQDPHSGVLYTMFSGVDATSPYSIVLTGLGAHSYEVGGFFEYADDAGNPAYGVSISNSATST